MVVDSEHWLTSVFRRRSINCDQRTDPEDICLLVVHAISLPPGEFGGGWVEDFFCNGLAERLAEPAGVGADDAVQQLVDVRVSAHAFISRRGKITQFVPFDHRAWHAGVSEWSGRRGCNDFSIGVELEGTDSRPFTNSQYRALERLGKVLLGRYPRLSLSAIVGHNQIAPDRKTDPGPEFDWPRFLESLT